jgi:hypothetical protein
VGARAVTRRVGLLRAVEARGTFCGFLSSQIAQPVVFSFCVGRGMVEGWNRSTINFMYTIDCVKRGDRQTVEGVRNNGSGVPYLESLVMTSPWPLSVVMRWKEFPTKKEQP